MHPFTSIGGFTRTIETAINAGTRAGFLVACATAAALVVNDNLPADKRQKRGPLMRHLRDRAEKLGAKSTAATWLSVGQRLSSTYMAEVERAISPPAGRNEPWNPSDATAALVSWAVARFRTFDALRDDLNPSAPKTEEQKAAMAIRRLLTAVNKAETVIVLEDVIALATARATILRGEDAGEDNAEMDAARAVANAIVERWGPASADDDGEAVDPATLAA